MSAGNDGFVVVTRQLGEELGCTPLAFYRMPHGTQWWLVAVGPGQTVRSARGGWHTWQQATAWLAEQGAVEEVVR